jgi:hypothetical protein
MYEKTTTECKWYNANSSKNAQAAFEAMFPEGHTPHVDTRTPKQVEADFADLADGWK